MLNIVSYRVESFISVDRISYLLFKYIQTAATIIIAISFTIPLAKQLFYRSVLIKKYGIASL
jgi:hypothetical protein